MQESYMLDLTANHLMLTKMRSYVKNLLSTLYFHLQTKHFFCTNALSHRQKSTLLFCCAGGERGVRPEPLPITIDPMLYLIHCGLCTSSQDSE